MNIATLDVKPGLEISVWDSAYGVGSGPSKVGIEILDGGRSLLAYLTAEQADELIRNLAVARVALGSDQ